MVVPDTIRLLLDGIGRSDEYEFYLRKFQSDRSAVFSVFVPDRACMSQAASVLAVNLQFLLRLGLVPGVLFAGPTAEDMVATLLDELSGRESAEVLRLPFKASADEAELIRVAAEEARRRGRYLVVAVDVPVLEALRRVCPVLSRRLLFLRMRGLLRDEHGNGISLYRIRRNEPACAADEIALRSLALALHDDAVSGHVAVASPLLMLKEIFTVKGAGTIMRPGSRILRIPAAAGGYDRERLHELLRNSFAREPLRRDFIVPGGELYLEEDYRGAIILEPHSAGTYLSKFSVGVQARGEGTAQELWEAVILDHPRLFWRARVGNPIGRWYSKLADGHHRSAAWIVFWKGVDPEHIPELIRFCTQRASDFVEGAV